MSTPNLTEDKENMNIPELGDILTVISTRFGSITGKIIYRDEKLIRVLPINASDRAYDLPLDLDDGDFLKETGITKCIIHSKREYPQFALQLGAVAGEYLEFFTNDGNIASESGIIQQIIADDSEDSIILTDGRRLDFNFIGPPSPIGVIRLGIFSNNTENLSDDILQPVTQLPDEWDLSLLDGLIPTAMMEEIPTADRTYPEIIQREDMYMDLLKSYPENKQKNPNLLRALARETEVLLALKNAVTVTNEKGETRPYIKSADSLQDILEHMGSPLSSIVPVLALKRILYSDIDINEKTSEEILDQVEFRDGIMSELRLIRATASYLAGQDKGGAAQISKLMYTYLYDILYRESAVFLSNTASKEGEEVLFDQDILRTVLPPEPVIGLSKISANAEIDASFVGPIKTRQHRVISSYKTRNQNVIAPGDPGTATNYLLFPASVGSMWRPNKYSGSISEDIRAGNLINSLGSIENITNDERSYNYDGVMVIKGLTTPTSNGEDANNINISEWLAKNLKISVHPSDLLSNSSVGIYRILDSIGLRSYEWTPEIANVIWSAIGKSQKLYNHIFKVYSKEIENYLKNAKPYALGNAIPDDSILYKKSMSVPEIANIINQINNETSDLVKAQTMLLSSEGTLARLLYAISNDNPHLEEIRNTYLAEVHRNKIHFKTVNNSLSKYKATPIINNCSHVNDMDTLRSLMKKDDSKFQAVLQMILLKYQGNRDNNWINCNICNGHLICIHEVMLLYERTHPGKAPALHKEILLDYGGAAFCGRYVCRFCGIPISDFEYDTHLEYDDEGRPLVGRNVIDDEDKTVEDELYSILNLSVKKNSILFDNPVQTELYDITRVMLQNTGFVFNDEIYTSIVMFAYNFISTELPPKDRYEAMIAKKKIKPSYESFRATNEITVIAAYILCLIHTMNPIPEILYPFTGCKFRMGGFPIENDNEDDLGAMEYFVCVIANLNRDSEPWNISMWVSDSSPEKRKDIVRNWIMNMFKSKDIHVLITKAKAEFTQNIIDTQSTASAKDRIPAYFRPTPNMKPAYFDTEIMTHPDRVMESVLNDELDTIEPIISQRTYQLACETVMQAHLSAKESGIIVESSQRSDSACCFSPIQNARKGIVSEFNPPAIEEELKLLKLAQTILHKRNPSEQSNGTHLYVHWSSPEAILPTPVKPDASYFKLFMRTCFRGPLLGNIHEFGRRQKWFECRHCRFRLENDPLILMSDLNDEEIFNNDSKRKGPPKTIAQDIARKSLQENGVEVNANSFRDLLSSIRTNRTVVPIVKSESLTSEKLFQTLDTLVNTNFPFIQARNVDWQMIVEIMKANFLRKEVPSDETRKIAWAPFVTRYDSLKANLIEILDGRQGRSVIKKISQKVENVLKAIERITEEPLNQGPNEINKHWVVGLERLAQNFNEMVFGVNNWFGQNVGNARSIQDFLFNGKKWFGKKISKRHSLKFEEMIQNILGTNIDTNKELNTPEIRKMSSEIIHKLSTYLGKIIRFWTTEMNSFYVYGVTNEELRYILRWIVFASIESLLLITSPIYLSIPHDTEKMKIQGILLRWTQTTFLEAQRQFNLFGLTAEEIQIAILDAREKEKNSVIKEFDDEKDPDMKAIALIQKNLKIGRWAIGTSKNLSSYNAEFYDFLQEQRDRMGIADSGVVKSKKEDALGFDMGKAENSAYDTAFAQHEDEGVYE